MPEDHFGEKVAARYDEPSEEMFEPAVDRAGRRLPRCARRRRRRARAGHRHGRIALPLAQRGVEVHGIDLSSAMVARLRAKPGGDEIPVTIGDFATARAEGRFSLAYLVFNTINNLTTQDAQVACFENVAAHLEPGGHFVIEVGVPQLQRLPPGETVRGRSRSAPPTSASTSSTSRGRGSISHHYELVDGAWQPHSVPFRYVWPSELDLMARIAGMTLVERWSGWRREPFTSESRSHVSVWRLSERA